SNKYSVNAKNGPVVRFEIFMYQPHDGESIFVDNVRLSTAREVPAAAATRFTVAGSDMVVADVQDLGRKLKAKWARPEPRTLDQLEAEFRAMYDELKKTHPKAVLAVLRDGETGYDPAHPDKAYAGWTDAYINSHGPDGMTEERSAAAGRESGYE